MLNWFIIFRPPNLNPGKLLVDWIDVDVYSHHVSVLFFRKSLIIEKQHYSIDLDVFKILFWHNP